MEKISKSIVDFICRNITIEDEEMIGVYKYGIEITLSSLINIMMILLCGLVFGDVFAGIIFLFCFIFLRSYTGGYHAETYLRCNIVFVCTYIAVFWAGRLLNEIQPNVIFQIILLTAAFIPIIRFAPVKNRHKELTESDVKRSRILSVIIYLFFSAASCLMCAFQIWYSYLISAALISVSLMIIAEVLMQKMGYHLSDKKD